MDDWERWGNATVATIEPIVAVNRFLKAAEGLQGGAADGGATRRPQGRRRRRRGDPRPGSLDRDRPTLTSGPFLDVSPEIGPGTAHKRAHSIDRTIDGCRGRAPAGDRRSRIAPRQLCHTMAPDEARSRVGQTPRTPHPARAQRAATPTLHPARR